MCEQGLGNSARNHVVPRATTSWVCRYSCRDKRSSQHTAAQEGGSQGNKHPGLAFLPPGLPVANRSHAFPRGEPSGPWAV